MKRLMRGMFLAAAAIVLTGCAAFVLGGAAGVGTVGYIKGELREQLPAGTETVRGAIDRSIETLGMQAVKTDADSLSGDYEARKATGEKVRIRYERVGESVTEVRVRVGTFGDENISRSVIEEIRKHL